MALNQLTLSKNVKLRQVDQQPSVLYFGLKKLKSLSGEDLEQNLCNLKYIGFTKQCYAVETQLVHTINAHILDMSILLCS